MKLNLHLMGVVRSKYTHKWENIPLFDMKKYHKHQECFGEGRQMHGKMEIETLKIYVEYSM